MKAFIQKIPKNMKIAIGVVIAVIIIALIVRGVRNAHKEPKAETEAPVVEIETPSLSAPAPRRGTRKSDVVLKKVPLDYTTMVNQYAGRQIQFGQSCQATPFAVTYKTGTSVFLDNRSAAPARIAIGSDVYMLGAYGYQVVTLATPGSFMIDCNDQQNVATVTIQK